MGMRKTSMGTDKRKLKIFSFFSGSGFLDLGFEKNGFDIELVNEYHPPFMAAYQYSRQKMGLRQPAFGYFNIDINDFLSTRSDELCQAIATARADGSFVGLSGAPHALTSLLQGKTVGAMGTTVNYLYPISSSSSHEAGFRPV